MSALRLGGDAVRKIGKRNIRLFSVGYTNIYLVSDIPSLLFYMRLETILLQLQIP